MLNSVVMLSNFNVDRDLQPNKLVIAKKHECVFAYVRWWSGTGRVNMQGGNINKKPKSEVAVSQLFIC